MTMPDWYDTSRHRLTADGIYRMSDNALLDADGRPQSGPLRHAEASATIKPEPEAPVETRRKKGE